MTKEQEIQETGDKKMLSSFRYWIDKDPEKAEAIYVRFFYGVSLEEHVKNNMKADQIEREWNTHKFQKSNNDIILEQNPLSPE